MQSFNNQNAVHRHDFTLENFQLETCRALDKFRKISDRNESPSKSDDNQNVNNDLLMKQINDLRRRLQLTETEIENYKKEHNIFVEEKRTAEVELENRSKNVENLKNRLEKKISFEK